MLPRFASRAVLLLGGVAALLALPACGNDKRTLLAPEERAQELVVTVLRAELPDSGEYTLQVRDLPAPAVDTIANIPLRAVAQLVQATDGSFWTVTQRADNARVLRVDPSGAVFERASKYRGLRGIAVDAAGMLYLSSYDSLSSPARGEIYSLATDSTLTKLTTGLKRPAQISLSPDQTKLYATSRTDNRIVEITLSGPTVANLAIDGTIPAPRALTFDSSGRMYVASDVNTSIYRLDLSAPPGPNGYAVETVTTIPEPTVGTMVWSNGVLYVTGGSRVYRIPDGGDTDNFLGSRLGGRMDADPGSLAQFVRPLGMVEDTAAGILYIADSGPNSAIRRVLLGQSQEIGTWLPEYGDASVYRIIPTAWTFGLDTGDRISLTASATGASVGSVAVGISEDRLSIFGLHGHQVWVQLEIYRYL